MKNILTDSFWVMLEKKIVYLKIKKAYVVNFIKIEKDHISHGAEETEAGLRSQSLCF